MKKRTIAILICVILLLGLLPMQVSADEGDEVIVLPPDDNGGGTDLMPVVDILLDIAGIMSGYPAVASVIKGILHVANNWISSTKSEEEAAQMEDYEKVAMYMIHLMEQNIRQNNEMIEKMEETAEAARNTDMIIRNVVLPLWIFLMVVRFMWRVLWGWIFSEV